MKQLKLQKLMLSITDEISMVSFKQYQQMNDTMCQLPPVGQPPIYISPHTSHTLDDLHQMDGKTGSCMRQKDVHFAQSLNKI